MVIVIAIVVGIAVVTVVAAALLAHRRRTTDADTAATPPPAGTVLADHPDPGPMTGLEDALNRLTDASGHTIAERLDEESTTVDELRIPDDTGPLLRRALDSLGTTDDTTDAGDAGDSADSSDA